MLRATIAAAAGALASSRLTSSPRDVATAWAGAILLVVALRPIPASAGATLQAIQSRSQLRCGVSEGISGFSIKDASGRWVGLDADFCRAVAAAVLGDPERVEFVPLRASMRFPALQSGKIDLLARVTTWTLTREALLKVQFPAVLLYEGQAFLVAKSAGITSPTDLNGATVCVEKGTTHQDNLTDYFGARGQSVEQLVLESAPDVADAFFAGRCRAYTSDAAQLAAARLGAPGGAQDYVILPERLSKEPLGPVVAGGDDEWVTLVRWVLYTLILAEEHGVTQANVAAVVQRSHGTGWRLASGSDERLARVLGVRPDWMMRAVQAVGNYGELYDRNLGGGSPLGLDRGLNRLWNQGGLMYGPPID